MKKNCPLCDFPAPFLKIRESKQNYVSRDFSTASNSKLSLELVQCNECEHTFVSNGPEEKELIELRKKLGK